MLLSLSISPEAEAKLSAKAAAAGVNVVTYAAQTLERAAVRPTLDEVLAPVRAEFEQSQMSEDALTAMLEQAKHEMRAEKRARRQP